MPESCCLLVLSLVSYFAINKLIAVITISGLNQYQYQLYQGLELESFLTLFVQGYRKLRCVFLKVEFSSVCIIDNE